MCRVAEVRVSYAPTEETTLLRNTAREFLSNRLPMATVREMMMPPDGFDRAVWEGMAELGWVGLAIPEEHGGAGYGTTELSVIFRSEAEARVSYAPPEETTLLRNTAREFLSTRLPMATVREMMMTPDGFDRAVWEEMAELGWVGLAIPEEHGGAGYGTTELSVIFEEMGRMVTPGPFFATVGLAIPVILGLADEAQKSGCL